MPKSLSQSLLEFGGWSWYSVEGWSLKTSWFPGRIIILEFVGTIGGSEEVASSGGSRLPSKLKQRHRALLELEHTSFWGHKELSAGQHQGLMGFLSLHHENSLTYPG